MLQKFIIKLFNRYLKRYVLSLVQEEIKKNEDAKVPDYKKLFKKIGDGYKIPLPNIIHNPQYMEIGENFNVLYNLRIEAWDTYRDQKFSPKITIGNNVIINTDCHIGCIEKIVIGNNVLIASRVYISDHSHGDTKRNTLEIPPAQRTLVTKGPIVIEDNVWLGEGVCILPGVTIGKGSIVGANSVVTKDVPSYSVVAGTPAKQIHN